MMWIFDYLQSVASKLLSPLKKEYFIAVIVE